MMWFLPLVVSEFILEKAVGMILMTAPVLKIQPIVFGT